MEGEFYEKEMKEVFFNFLQNLKTVLRLFLNPDLELVDEAINKAHCQLVDANGTLSLLKLDVEKGDPNPTGLPASAIQEPLQNLSDCISSRECIFS